MQTYNAQVDLVEGNILNQFSPFFEDSNIVARISCRPSTPGDTIVRFKAGQLHTYSNHQLAEALLSVKAAAAILKNAAGVQRIGLVTTSDDEARLIPLHGLSAEWGPVLDSNTEYHASYPGYISSKRGPGSPSTALDAIWGAITVGRRPGWDFTYLGDEATKDSIFARLIRGQIVQWRVWESSSHVAFLTPFGNTPGYTLLVPRMNHSSDVLAMPDDDFRELAGAIWEVSRFIEHSALGASRVGFIFEGMDINYAQVRLIPILNGGYEAGGGCDECAYTEKYAGSISSKPGPFIWQA